jgi:membrane-associated protease RseP (regulator of RpoE activity)
LSPFGTMGAVIRMQGSIARRASLLDIGASGPLAGLTLAIPLYAWGVRHSTIVPREAATGIELGESILLKALDHVALGALPSNREIELSPMAFAAWAGMFVTMINLLPVGQLDGGHVAYALFGKRQDRYARIVHRLALAVFAFALLRPIVGDLLLGRGIDAFAKNAENSVFWLVWFMILPVLGAHSRARKTGGDPPSRQIPIRTRIVMIVAFLFGASAFSPAPPRLAMLGWIVMLGGLLFVERTRGTLRTHDLFDHPPTEDDTLDTPRKIVGFVTLVLFVLLFMPSPMTPITTSAQ